MNIIELIDKKRLKQELSSDELKFIVDGYLKNDVKDYQMSAFLMAVVINGMTLEETVNLTEIFKNSGDILDLSNVKGIKADKHSTGGVGDKVTLVLAPIVASLGINVAKLSGRGLGFTGGTIDKLESIPGFNTSLTNDEFLEQLKNIGIVIAEQTADLVPADKKIYALRDVTGTVESIPLIAASIMSKKLAVNSDVIVIDLKVGKGALMKNEHDAKALATTMVEIGKRNNKKIVCILSNMDEPLGYAIGNTNEVIESINTLKGNGPKDLVELVIYLAKYMVSLSKNIDIDTAEKLVIENLNNNKALEKFKEMVVYQKGDLNSLSNDEEYVSIKSKKSGQINEINALKMGEIVRNLGAGRIEKNDIIDNNVGIILNKKVGDFVLEHEELLKVCIGKKNLNIIELIECFVIENSSVTKKPLIIDVVK